MGAPRIGVECMWAGQESHYAHEHYDVTNTIPVSHRPTSSYPCAVFVHVPNKFSFTSGALFIAKQL
jgi:hypothetical protein